MRRFLPIFLVLALATTTAAGDPGPLQDFCVATNCIADAVLVNGQLCKDPMKVTVKDFVFTGLRTGESTHNPLNSGVKPGFVDQFVGINTLGISLGRIDFAPYGLNPPHIHPRASEVFHVLEGTLYAGFVTSNENGHRLFTTTLYKGDVMVFPIGLVHFQYNIGHTNALAIASFGSQNPGILHLAPAIFGSNPPIRADVLAKAFQDDPMFVKVRQSKNWTGY